MIELRHITHNNMPLVSKYDEQKCVVNRQKMIYATHNSVTSSISTNVAEKEEDQGKTNKNRKGNCQNMRYFSVWVHMLTASDILNCVDVQQ